MIVPEQVITGEGVVVDIAPAPLPTRMGSAVIDYAVYFLGLSFSLRLLYTAVNQSTVTAAVLATSVALMLAFWLIFMPWLVEVLSRGRSLGRLVMGLRIVRDDGGPAHPYQSFVRAICAPFEVLFTSAIVAVVVMLFSKRSKRVGDMLAGTYAAQEDNIITSPPVLIMPPELRYWARGADIRELPTHLSLSAYTFLQRASSLDLRHRASLGQALADQVSGLVSPPPPPHTHPERLLAAVLVERRDREYFLNLQRERRHQQQQSAAAQLPYGLGTL